jgi:hypothetical protein
MASCEATGPSDMVCGAPSSVATTTGRCNVCGTPSQAKNSPATTQMGSNTNSTARVMSTQKLPIVATPCRAKPRTSATATAMPAAADKKLCTPTPAICDR